MEEIERELTALKPAKPPGKATVRLPVAGVDDIFDRIEAGALAEAEAQMRFLDRSVPKDQASEVWFHLGLAFQNNHENQRAMAAYARACELNPANLQACFNSGMIQHEEGMLHPALKSYERSLEIDPQQAKIWCNLGALQFQLGEFQKSVDSFNKAVALKPDYARAWDNLAGSLCALDQLDEAENCCRRALNFKDGYADPYFKLGSIYFQRGSMEEAEEAFRKVLEVNPGYPLAGHYLAMVLARTRPAGGGAGNLRTRGHALRARRSCRRRPGWKWASISTSAANTNWPSAPTNARSPSRRSAPWSGSTPAWRTSRWASSTRPAATTSRPSSWSPTWPAPGTISAWSSRRSATGEGGQEALDEAERLLARGR